MKDVVDQHERPRGPLLLVALVVAAIAVVVVFTAGDTTPTTTFGAPPLAVDPPPMTPPPPTTTTTPPATARTITDLPRGQAPGWSAISGGPLTPRFGAESAWVDGMFVVWGGQPAGSGGTSDGAVFRPGGTWGPTAAAPVGGGDTAVVVAMGDRMFVAGHDGATLYDPATDSWASLSTPDLPLVSQPLVGAWTGAEVIVIGATPAGAQGAIAIGPDGECCRILAAPPIDLTEAWAFWTGDRVLVIGGHFDADTRRALTDRPQFASYDPAADEWETLPSPDLAGVQAIVAAWNGTELFVWDYLNRAAAWRPDREWRALPDLPFDFSECYPEGAADVDGRVFAYYCGAATFFDPIADRWVRIATPEVDSRFPRGTCTVTDGGSGDTELWMWCSPTTGDDPVLWQIDLDAVETIAVSEPATASAWELVPHPQWTARVDASPAWTGSELIVWGGFDGITEVFDGWAYDPDTGVMHRIPDAPTPGRPGQSGVWTGTELVVWRGSITAWDPVAVEWREIELTTPSSQLHPGNTAVWTGGEVLFWGATQFVGGSEGGASLDLDTGVWRRLPASDLGGRLHPVVVWSGEEMYVWGGLRFGSSGWSQEGAAYDPATDTWRSLAALPDGAGLANPVGAWVNDELVVFGLSTADTTGPAMAGAAYTPADNSWRVIAELPGPVPGDPPQAMWSATAAGDRLAVWLPAPFFGETSGLAFYDPGTDSWSRVDGAPLDASAPDLVEIDGGVAALTETGLLLYRP